MPKGNKGVKFRACLLFYLRNFVLLFGYMLEKKSLRFNDKQIISFQF